MNNSNLKPKIGYGGSLLFPFLFLALALIYSCKSESPISGLSYSSSNPYEGSWHIVFSGNYTGANTLNVGSDGSYILNVSLRDPLNMNNYVFQGTVTKEGILTGQTSCSGQIIGSISGSFHGTTGGGIWMTQNDTSGYWSASRHN